ncbi:MGMT family protein [Microvirga sp. GCM10011540]|uniref:MGMT family protein n=1 Tax=Microvirga sp. GCM10011540 TaxID=3317338 RepID=UPI003614C5E1
MRRELWGSQWPATHGTVVVPCHRVLAASGKQGGFSAYGGVALKRELLRMECAMPNGLEPALPGLFDDAIRHHR